MVRVISSRTGGHGSEEEAATSPDEQTGGDLPETGGTSFPTVASTGLFAAGLAIGLMAALLRRRGSGV